MIVQRWQDIALPEETEAVTFEYLHQGKTWHLRETGFAIRFHNRIHVYCNRCPHAGSPLDWTPGQFFTDDRSLLICQTHGACFDPATGAPVAGPPCPHGLQRLPFRVDGDRLLVPATIRPEISTE